MNVNLNIVQLLGGKKLLGVGKLRSEFAFHELVSSGLPAKCVLHFKKSSGFTNVEVSELLGISEKTFFRWQDAPDNQIDPVSSDRLYRSAKILALATEVLEDGDEARAWLNEPQMELGDKIPRALLTTDAGTRQVEDLLLRMEHGYLA